MDEDTVAYLALYSLGGATLLFMVSAIIIFRAKKYWASSLAFIGSLFSFLGWLLFLAFALNSDYGDQSLSNSDTYLVTTGCFALIGIVLSMIGLIGLCARLKTTHKRRMELEQILSILQSTQKSR